MTTNTSTKEPKRVAIYIRVSTLDQAREGYSLEAQEKTLRQWVIDNGYEVYDLYADRGISGKSVTKRPDMKRLIKDAEDKKFDVVLFWALSRFTRSVSDLYDVMCKLNDLGILFVSHTEPFDTRTPMGRAMFGMIVIFAQLELELTAERTLFAMNERASQGKRTCTDVLGYAPNGDSFLIIPKEAEQVRFIFNSYLNCKNLSKVAKMCWEKNYFGKRGKKHTAYTVTVVLTRPLYCGYNTYNGKIYKGNHLPIIDTKTFNDVQKLLIKQGKGNRKRKIHIIKE